jgi:hypothetical protein
MTWGQLDEEIVGLAGLWEWQAAEDKGGQTGALVTTDQANRQPIGGDASRW